MLKHTDAFMRTVNNLLLILLPGVFLLYTQACKKEQEATPPVVSVTYPYGSQEFKVGDSIYVRASITSEQELTSVKVVLVNGSGIPMLVPRYLYPGGTSFELDYLYPVNEDLESGNYSLLISASNNSHTTKIYTDVVITGPGTFFKQLIAVCQPNSLNTALYGIDASGEYNGLIDFESGYTGSEISSNWQQFYIVRPSPSRLYAYNMEKWEEDYMVEASPPHPEFYSIYVADYPGLAYVPNGNGEIRGYDHLGLPIFVTKLNTDTVPVLCRKHDNKILAYSEYRGGPERFIRQYYAETGEYRVSLNINFTAIDFFQLETGYSLIFGNDDSGGKVYTLDVAANAIIAEQSLGGGMVRNVINTGDKSYLFSMDAIIYRYDHDPQMIVSWNSGVQAGVLVYDDLRQLIYAAEGQNIFMYSYPDGLLLHEVTLPYEIVNLHIHYNR